MSVKAAVTLGQRIETFATTLAGTRLTDRVGETLSLETGIDACLNCLRQVRKHRGSVYVIGNGGSAAVAAHIVNDFVNTSQLRAQTIHDPSLLTCMTNDYGYEQAYARILDTLLNPGDLLIAISSSGNSANMSAAVATAREHEAAVITLSGFKAENRLRGLGDYNFWLDISHYGCVEIGHLFLLHHLADRLKEEGSC